MSIIIVFSTVVSFAQSLSYEVFEIKFRNFDNVEDSYTILNQQQYSAVQSELYTNGNCDPNDFPDIDFSKYVLLGIPKVNVCTYKVLSVTTLMDSPEASVLVETCELGYLILCKGSKWLKIKRDSEPINSIMIHKQASCLPSN